MKRLVMVLVVSIAMYYITSINYQRIKRMETSVNLNNITETSLKVIENDVEDYYADDGSYKYGKGDWFKDKEIVKRTTNCEMYFRYMPVVFTNEDVNTFEQENVKPSVRLAFSHMLHNQVVIYETFLAMYFRPYNYYCVHVDKKAEKIVRKAVEGLVNCYSEKITTGQIFVVEKEESIEVCYYEFNNVLYYTN